MKKDLTEIVFIIDRSGSMSGLEKDTIGGFNSFVERQKKQPGEANITTILFDDKLEILHQRENVHLVEKMNENQYYVRGCTALLDAIGYAINKTIDIQKKLPYHQKADKVLFVITTDGYENASKEYNYSIIHKMINYQKERYNWEFLFLGANIDAAKEAHKLGIHASRAVKYYHDESGVEASYDAAGDFAVQFRQSCKVKQEDESWKRKVVNNFKKKRYY